MNFGRQEGRRPLWRPKLRRGQVRAAYDPLMVPVLAAKVWTYWISIVLVASAVLTVLAVGLGYLVKVYSTRFPKQ